MSLSGTVVVLTALGLEYLAVQKYLRDSELVRHGTGTVFEVGRVAGTAWRVALAEVGEGNRSAAVVTEQARQTFDPEALLFVGVAGGLKDDLALGDVVIATRVYAAHGGKEAEEGFLARPEGWAGSHALLQTARHALRGPAWHQRLNATGAPGPRVWFKPIAAGDVVLNSATAPLRGQLHTHYNDAVAIEMESAGMAHAAQIGRLQTLTVRGISDRADGTKYAADDASHQPRAAAYAAAAALSVIRHLPLPPRSDTTTSPPSASPPDEPGPRRNRTVITDDNPTATDLDRAADRLRKDVLSRARHAVARLELQRPTLIEIAWKGSGRPVQPSRDVLGVAPEELMGTVTQVPDTCRQLPLRQLVVLGAPGTGKSVVAIQLVHEMTREPRPGDPVPVLMSLSSWRPAISMREWILRQIRQSSPGLAGRWRFGVDAAAGLFDEGMVMPVLDGLDELPERLRGRAIEAIDKVIRDGCWLLVTCRGDEYETACGAGSHLTRAAVVELEAVEAKAAIAYLTRSKLSGDDRWNVVFDAMREEPGSRLARTMASPLMLYLAKTAYRAHLTEPGELVSKTHSKEDIEDTLLNRYLPAVYAEDPPTRYREAPAKRYLTLMARQMRRDGTVDFAWWQINARLTGPLVGLAFGSVWGWFLHMLFGPMLGVMTGLFAGLGGWVAHAAVRYDLKQVYVPKAAEHGPKALLHRYALIAVASALAVGGITALSAASWLMGVVKAEGQTAWYYGTIVGAASGTATLLGSAWGSYQLSRSWFWLTRRLPWRLPPFLDDARELGVLRQIGPVHQFRHERVLRQLGGAIVEKPSRSVHGEWNAKWQRWRPLLPAFASLSQVGSALLGLAVVSLMYVSSTKIELRYQSGDKPRYFVDTSFCVNQVGSSCTGVAIWSWKLPQGSSRHTVWLPGTLHGRSIQGWDGRIAAVGCAGGAVKVTLALAGEAPVAFTLSDSAEVPMKDLSEPARPERRPVSLTLRRLDDRPCSLVVEWASPGLVDDGLEPARKRLGVAAPAMTHSAPRKESLVRVPRRASWSARAMMESAQTKRL
ncbi:5'-methylthioadenosine/S-adenosylhomocysteine nucleosidase [Streptomyces rapamycinicus]|uniref:Nucleoside phosphorylase domain-containing protein n=1 Tax=Streptomyces rapamycinicus (strain ATCC 29253 / DSM 41530 / NRRL 5491 / AYB-994) TaxID=1343740 RepID=A0A0A0NIT0_STRRN|nr:5'-methylthioadenosine/S-adenosylhomocysteine nucleosidase [Streptomyces rapamycinicus]AGP59447.1 hypothetical protein M271_40335 [Streptomyces rapamycinicus NRRL 5491]RLV77360.1 hypothetical protein D3C57_103285 [Streptomyces rapamycinicus NRRL 5491]UTP35120.1 NACHT domain-containing protein [Streptomyces rapamycinicus NRRL 5491]